jgi:hypothetical protein
MMRIWVLAVIVVMLAGCGDLEYRGYDPSVRSFSDDPNFDDLYIGADAKFDVIEDGKRRPTPSASARRETYDVWNTPIDWTPSRPGESLGTTTASTPAD